MLDHRLQCFNNFHLLVRQNICMDYTIAYIISNHAKTYLCKIYADKYICVFITTPFIYAVLQFGFVEGMHARLQNSLNS